MEECLGCVGWSGVVVETWAGGIVDKNCFRILIARCVIWVEWGVRPGARTRSALPRPLKSAHAHAWSLNECESAWPDIGLPELMFFGKGCTSIQAFSRIGVSSYLCGRQAARQAARPLPSRPPVRFHQTTQVLFARMCSPSKFCFEEFRVVPIFSTYSLLTHFSQKLNQFRLDHYLPSFLRASSRLS